MNICYIKYEIYLSANALVYVWFLINSINISDRQTNRLPTGRRTNRATEPAEQFKDTQRIILNGTSYS